MKSSRRKRNSTTIKWDLISSKQTYFLITCKTLSQNKRMLIKASFFISSNLHSFINVVKMVIHHQKDRR